MTVRRLGDPTWSRFKWLLSMCVIVMRCEEKTRNMTKELNCTNVAYIAYTHVIVWDAF